PCFSHFQELLKDQGFPLLEKLKKDKILQREELYYLALHFIEKLQKEREFAAELLKILAKKYPRSKVGLSSKKLLQESRA
ncbi:MAG: hypothetical protein KJ645_04685, partial [Planctomycetes bacterium]|nr:hypothetical protein [Planctomycetota bacterium]